MSMKVGLVAKNCLNGVGLYTSLVYLYHLVTKKRAQFCGNQRNSWDYDGQNIIGKKVRISFHI